MLATAQTKLIAHKRINSNLIHDFLGDFDTFFNSRDMAAFSPDLMIENVNRDEIQLLRTGIRKMGEMGRKKGVGININLSTNLPEQGCNNLWCSGHHHSFLDDLKQTVGAIRKKGRGVVINLDVSMDVPKTYNCGGKNLKPIYLEH
ncbi:MAG: hypothetical protein GPJ54_20865 [Candidatus Heimdallarchaeota archaeon]|nr:hypothetical protein [Candidatus Heimdallarchaeota archaeon]